MSSLPEVAVVDLDAPAIEPLTRYAAWRPRWLIDMGDGDQLGVAVDDGCFVVLYPHAGEWRPGTHIPERVAARISELVTAGTMG